VDGRELEIGLIANLVIVLVTLIKLLGNDVLVTSATALGRPFSRTPAHPPSRITAEFCGMAHR
jgi:hypothetical protein